MNLHGKRLLLLGGGTWKKAIRKFADETGVVLVATGNDPHGGIFEIADECYTVDSTDSEAMKVLISQKQIDGVYMGGSEPVISAACQYVSELGLPCYCTHEQWETMQNKKKFKDLCLKFGLPVAQLFPVDPNDPHLEAACYPVVAKPEDGCGSKGVSVCHNDEELKRAYRLAVEKSANSKALVEKFVKNKSICVYYTFHDGNAVFSCSADKIPVFYESHETYVGGLYLFQSEREAIFRERYEQQLKELFRFVNISEGTMWLEIFCDGDSFYFNEVGFRYCGSVASYPVEYISGINQIYMDLEYAVSGKSRLITDKPLIPKRVSRGLRYCVYPVHAREGLIQRVDGLDQVLSRNNMIDCFMTKSIGDYMPDTGAFTQILFLVHFVYQDNDELKATIEYIHDTLKVWDDHGQNLVNRKLDIYATVR